MKKIRLKPLFHRGQESIGMYFENYSLLNRIVRKLPGVKWSQTNKCWYVPLSKENYNQIYFALKGKADIDKEELQTYLADKKKKIALPATVYNVIKQPKTKILPSPASKKIGAIITSGIKNQVTVHKGGAIYPVNAHVIPAMQQQLRLKSYSPSTIKTYLNEAGVFLRTIKQHPADSFDTPRIKDYLQYCAEKLQLSENTLHSRMNALKFYYEQVMKREKFFWDIPRPKKANQLPKVLSKEEMIRLIKAIENLKHKTMIMLGYACGLRVSEITGLERRYTPFLTP
jgi:integrase/recombinase XerD